MDGVDMALDQDREGVAILVLDSVHQFLVGDVVQRGAGSAAPAATHFLAGDQAVAVGIKGLQSHRDPGELFRR